MFSCQEEEFKKEVTPPNLPETTYDYKDVSAVPTADVEDLLEEISSDWATLGRVLFYDRHLSENNSVSCGSCHFQHLDSFHL